MRPDWKELLKHCPGVREELVQEHLSRLDERYFRSFDVGQICSHLRELNQLSTENPVRLLLYPQEGQTVQCTILAFDYPGEFSTITGILAASGFNILSGDVFTYAHQSPKSEFKHRHPVKSRRRRLNRSAPAKRRRIIDQLIGVKNDPTPFELWERTLMNRLTQAIRLLEDGGEAALTRSKKLVNESVAQRLAVLRLEPQSVLYPVTIDIDNQSAATILKVVSQDTPFFLYSLTTALSLRGVSIESVRIRTIEQRIEDEIGFLNANGSKIVEPEILDQIKLSVLLTKQFTYFLGSAPDPYAALHRFEHLVQEILPEQGRWLNLLTDPLVLKDLARLLGASDYLWEEFVRLQYETLLPMMAPHVRGQRFSQTGGDIRAELGSEMTAAESLAEEIEILNAYKDRSIFLLEMDHILDPQTGFQKLSQGLTHLAEAVVAEAVRAADHRLRRRFGRPKTVAGLNAKLAVCGLGKLGGGELGYASDIELLFVYSDAGRTDGAEQLTNAEYFSRLAENVGRMIRSKQEGIFEVDLRLRPYGASGPRASSLESFCAYFGLEGEAHALEKLALLRLRAIAGDPELGARIERLRDEMIYPVSVSLTELRDARQRQLMAVGTSKNRLNAKFSPGALVDLETAVLLLQVMYGVEKPEIRTPQIRAGIDKLEAAKILNTQEAARIREAYIFLRRLINGLRMLRGSARDLFLPDIDSDEYVHLARRMEYSDDQALSPAQQLHTEFETHTASIRVFVESHLGRDSLPGPASGNIADVILSEQLPQELRDRVLKSVGFENLERAYVNLRALAGQGLRRSQFARLAVLAADILHSQPDPDMALNNWERFYQTLDDPDRHFQLLLSQPKRLEILLSLFSGSQFLSDTMIHNPDFFEWATYPEHLHRLRERAEMFHVFQELTRSSQEVWQDGLRRYRRREILRIGIRDICLGSPIEDIMAELSNLAEAVIESALNRVRRQTSAAGDLCILALGKLGGSELNYSSDLDLLVVVPDGIDDEARQRISGLIERLRDDLAGHSAEGYAYRIDLRLRPYGAVGELVPSLTELLRYYREQAALWEIQALLKVRPVAGDRNLGQQFTEQIGVILSGGFDKNAVYGSILELRRAAHVKLARGLLSSLNIKLAAGGIRDIEFIVQALQLVHAGTEPDPEMKSGTTIKAIAALDRAGILKESTAGHLRRDYLFLRRVEHYLQIFEDRQTHALPQDPAQMQALAKRMLGPEADSRGFLARVQTCMKRVEVTFEDILRTD